MSGRTSQDHIRTQALALGFSACGFTRADAIAEAAPRLQAFLALDRHGTMEWLADPRRAAPARLWRDAQGAIVVALNYGPAHDPLAVLEQSARGAISVYAQNRDYHDVLKGKLKTLAGFAQRQLGGDVKVFVDTAALMEKPLAEAAGIGWQGKHTNLVSRSHGSWLFLGVILTSADAGQDTPHGDHCGACRACLDVCPTGAFPAPYQLDARRCISYLTIEHKGPIARAFRPLMGNRIYGCDDCLAVCPWNKFAQAARETKLQARPDLRAPDLAALSALDENAFRALFAGSPVKRTGRARFVRNVLIAIGNSGLPGLAAAAQARLSDDDALVRGAAVWALQQLLPAPDFLALRAAHQPHETDPGVQAEWTDYSPSNSAVER